MRVLIAEDDLTTRTILVGLLKKWNYEPVIVTDGQAAWDVLQQPDTPPLAILDWMMPGIDGLQVIRQVRFRHDEPPPYIILLTSRDQKGDVLTGLESGANDYIKKPFSQEELFARIRVGQRSIELQARLYETQQILAHHATHDPLTGILNRRAILEQLSKELSRARRNNLHNDAPRLSIGFFDIDKFKLINDQYGHQAGDEVLKGVVNLVVSHLRAYDSFGRLGGDEFLVIAPETDGENCQSLFERLAALVAGCHIQTNAGDLSVTVSIGIATAGVSEELDKFLDNADAAMYQGKRRGGNQAYFEKKK